jgi:hypothetical protein
MRKRKPKQNEAPPSTGDSPPPPDPAINGFPADLLRSYRACVGNSTTYMCYLGYLAHHSDAVEDTLIQEVMRAIKTKPRNKHVRYVLFSLFASNFVSTKHAAHIYMTDLGRRGYANLCERDKQPPATEQEVAGLRTLIKKSVLIRETLVALRTHHSATQSALRALVLPKYELEVKDTPSEGAHDRVLVNLASIGWVEMKGDAYLLSELGKRACDDLHFQA